MRCNNCMWAIWDNGIQVVDCMACGNEKCPTDADFEVAKSDGYLAYYGCSKEDEEEL